MKIAAEFVNKHTWQEAAEEDKNPQVFVPASGVRHRLLKRKSTKGKFVNKTKLEKEGAMYTEL